MNSIHADCSFSMLEEAAEKLSTKIVKAVKAVDRDIKL